MSSKNFFQKIEKTIDDVIFPVSVSNFAGLGLKAKIEIETGLGLGKILQSRSWSRTSRSRLQPWLELCEIIKILYSFLKKRPIKPAAFLSLFHLRPINCLKNLSTAMNATRHATRILLRGMNQKKFFLLKKLSDLGPVLNKLMLFKCVTCGA